MSIEAVLAKVRGVRRHGDTTMAICPAHDDKQASLAIRVVEDGKVLLKCHANCPTETIVAAAGLSMSDLFGDATPPQRPVPQFGGLDRVKPKLVAAYVYRDATGAVLYEACRYEPKTFRQRRPDGHGGYLWNLEGVPRVLYRLPELLASKKAVIVVEGEKDVDNLYALGCVATCNVGGAGKWRDEYNEHLRGRQVVILPDNDHAGAEHADKVARALVGIAASVKVVPLPGLAPKGDVSDWIAAGGTKKRLVEIMQAAPEFDPSAAEVVAPIAAAPSTTAVAELHAITDAGLEDLLVGWMLTANAVERGQWFGRIILDLVAQQERRMLVEAILETHGVTATVDPVAILAHVRKKCASLDRASVFTMADLQALGDRARGAQVQPATLLAALDDWRLQRSVKRVQAIALAGDGRTSVERMRVALAGEVELSPVEPALDYGRVVVERAKMYFAEPENRQKVTTVGLDPFDRVMGGFLPGLVYIASRPSVGKTAIAFRMARGVVETMQRPALFVSLEMKAGPIHDRVIADFAEIENKRVRRSDWFNEEEQTRVVKASARAYELYAGKLFIIEDSTAPFDQLLAAMHRHMQAHPDTAAVFFDYLQLAHGFKAESREQEISGISRTLKRFAEQYNIPVFALAQLNRSSETEEKGKKNREGRPRMRHLRGSGALEQDGDDIILLHVREEYRPDEPRAEEVALYAYHDKVRNGPTAVYVMTFNRPYQRVIAAPLRALE